MGEYEISVIGARAFASPKFAYVGCMTHGTHTHHAYAHGKGISVYRIDPQSGAWTLVEVCEATPNPGFLVFDQKQRFLYTVHGTASDVSAFSIDQQTGKLAFLNKQQTRGDNSVHLTIDPTNRYIVLANGPGIVVYPINADGSLAPSSHNFVPSGKPGPYLKKQKAHPHHVVFDPTGRFFVATDTGFDQIHIYRLDTASGKLVANDFPFVKGRSGSCPRHIAFHPNTRFAYVVNELDSTATAYGWNGDRGELKPIQILPLTPPTFTDNNEGSEVMVAPSGNFVYIANRGHDSIAIFAVDPSNGMLNPIGWEPTQGKTPRFFTLDQSGNMLCAANVVGDTIVIFNVDSNTGKLTPTGQIVETASPSCIVFSY